jgi:hypothetical protein
MQTRKKSAARYAAGDHANPKTSRPTRKATQLAAAEKKVADLITSSSKKQRPGKFNRSCGNVSMHMQQSRFFPLVIQLAKRGHVDYFYQHKLEKYVVVAYKVVCKNSLIVMFCAFCLVLVNILLT